MQALTLSTLWKNAASVPIWRETLSPFVLWAPLLPWNDTSNPPETDLHNVPPTDLLDAASFRSLMSQFTTGVCVVSTLRKEAESTNEIAGITVNSLVSVSLDPLLVCWSLQNQSSQFDLWSGATDFTISILAEGQAELAKRYAARGSSALDAGDYVTSPGGLPVIKGALGFIECRQWSLYQAGDHTMVFGEVIGLSKAPDAKPLGFFRGDFCRIIT